MTSSLNSSSLHQNVTLNYDSQILLQKPTLAIIGAAIIEPSQTVKNLGVYLDKHMRHCRQKYVLSYQKDFAEDQVHDTLTK